MEEILKSHKLTQEDYKQIQTILNRDPNLLEIGIFSALWSEHCSYKSSKKYLKDLPTNAPQVLQGPGENAGAVDIGGGYAAIFKIESHNHPSFIEPYAGSSTGVGGILRDIFTMGAKPVANLNSIRFGEIQNNNKTGKKHRYLLEKVVQGIGDYGNCMGIATIGGETGFEACYNGNILVNAFSLGIAESGKIFYGKATGEGNSVIYVGNKTGADGLGGAVMSSDAFRENPKSLCSAVQIGDPLREKLLLEACLELFEKDFITGIQDMGAAGLTSSSFEMAERGGCGMALYLQEVPTTEKELTPYEIMLSESQERMLVCAKKGFEEEVIKIFEKWGVLAKVIGKITVSKKMELFWEGKKCAEIPISYESPILQRPCKKPQYIQTLQQQTYQNSNISQQKIFETILGHVEVCDKAWIYSQYDTSIGANTIIGSDGGDASVIRVRENNSYLAMNVYCNPRYCYIDPKEGAKIAVSTAGRNCIIRGAKVLGISDCLNFGNPENPEVMWQFQEVIAGIKEACEVLKIPVVSGNVSFYNQTQEVDIYPTPAIVAVGLLTENKHILSPGLKKEGNLLVLLGEIKKDFGGSLIQKITTQSCSGKVPFLDLQKELDLWNCIGECLQHHILSTIKDISKGGLAITLAKMALKGEKGIKVRTPFKNQEEQDMIFAESQSCVIVEVCEHNLSILQQITKKYKIPLCLIGEVLKKEGHIAIDSILCDIVQASILFFESFQTKLGL